MILKIVDQEHESWEGTLWGIYEAAASEDEPPILLVETRKKAEALLEILDLDLGDYFIARTECRGRYRNVGDEP